MDRVVGRAGFEFAELKALGSSSPATHRFLRADAYLRVVCLIGWVTLHQAVEVYSVSVTMAMVTRKLYQAELPPDPDAKSRNS